ncbi:MAG: hypothetical protein U5K37_04455 [Natrialbaceae archaeon]|nr:hypothetical protein [Natrialbaceae archaeon]
MYLHDDYIRRAVLNGPDAPFKADDAEPTVMVRTPAGTDVGVDNPYAFVDRCDHCTDDGRCRLALEGTGADPTFRRERAAEDYRCLFADRSSDDGRIPWEECPHMRSRTHDQVCRRCGLEEHRDAHSSDRPLLEEHHLAYAEDDALGHEVTVVLCRWCHAKVHTSWARLADDATPDPKAIAEREARRSREQAELTFETAADREDSRMSPIRLGSPCRSGPGSTSLRTSWSVTST